VTIIINSVQTHAIRSFANYKQKVMETIEHKLYPTPAMTIPSVAIWASATILGILVRSVFRAFTLPHDLGFCECHDCSFKQMPDKKN
jgi:hypothetical protein